MRVVVLAGGLGTRLSEHTQVRPKPMVEIGERPVLWHILKLYSAAGLRHFVIALGYRGEAIKSFFLHYQEFATDLTIETATGHVSTTGHMVDDWEVDLVDTGPTTDTGGRVARLRPWLPDEDFCLTYGDGVSDVDLKDLIAFHHSHDKLATITAVRPPARFGDLALDGDRVASFREKPAGGSGWINGGFMVFRRDVLERIAGDATSLEHDVLESLAADGEVMAFRHDGFWQCVDTLNDVRSLQAMWESGDVPWRTWT